MSSYISYDPFCDSSIQSCEEMEVFSSSGPIIDESALLCPAQPNEEAPSDWKQFQSNPPLASRLWNFPKNASSVIINQTERKRILGPYLANQAFSPEEDIPTTAAAVSLINIARPLSQVWAQLPLRVRVFLDQQGLRSEAGLGIAYETGNASAGLSPRWHVFQMSAATPQASGSSGGSGSGGEMSPPSGRPTMNISLGGVALGAGLTIGIDLGIKKIFPNMPSEFRLPANLATFYGVQYMLFRLNFMKAPSWGAVWKPMTASLPTMFTLGMASCVLLDLLGRALHNKNLQMGTAVNEYGSMLLTYGTYLTLIRTEFGMKFLTGTGGGLSGTLGIGARALGYAAIIGLSWKIGKKAGMLLTPHVRCGWSDENCKSNWRVWNKAEEITMQNFALDSFGKYGGAVFLGSGLLDFLTDITQMVSSTAEDDFRGTTTQTYKQLFKDSQEFGKWLRNNVAMRIADSIEVENGEINWAMAEEKIKDFYQSEKDEDPSNDSNEDNNQAIIKRGYEDLDDTGFVAFEAAEIKKLVEKDGSIEWGNRRALAQLASTEIWLAQEEKNNQLRRLGESIGNIRVVGNEIFFIPPESLSEEQAQRMENEYMPLASEVLALESIEEKLRKYSVEE